MHECESFEARIYILSLEVVAWTLVAEADVKVAQNI